MKQAKKILAVLLAFSLIFSQTSLSFAAGAAAPKKTIATSTPSQKWPAWVKVGGKVGDHRQLGLLDIFVPFMQSENDLWFIDARDKDAGGSENEWNLGAGYRRMMNDNLILGVYGFFDRIKSSHSNYFSQTSFGVEALTKNLDFRVNAYFPQDKIYSSGVGFEDNLIISGTSINYESTSGEQALPGFDAEFGFRIPKISPDIRLYAGGFYFHRSGVPEVAGPRLRSEWRIDDLFGFKGTRLTIEGEYTHDDVRNSKGFGGASVRIPFGFSANTSMPAKDTLKARMVEPIIRDVDIVTVTPKTIEPAINPLTGEAYSGIWFAEEGGTGDGSEANPTDLLTAIASAGVNGIIAALDTNGVIDLAVADEYTAVLLDGQTLIGSGGDLEIQSPSGAIDTFHIVGDTNETTITNSDSEYDVIQLANNNHVSDLMVHGGYHGIGTSEAMGGGEVHLNNVTVQLASEEGVHLENTGDIIIENSNFGEVDGDGDGNGNDYRGLAIHNAGDVTITDSTANHNIGRGINIRNAGNVTLDNVEASDSEHSLGIKIYNASGDVTLTDVIADSNEDTNLLIDGVEGDVLINTSEDGYSSFSHSESEDGIDIEDVTGDVTISNVNADENAADNIYINGIDGGPSGGGNVLIQNTSAHGYYYYYDNQAYYSDGNGIDISNVYHDDFGVGGNVTLTNVEADGNYYSNLYIGDIDGNVLINNSGTGGYSIFSDSVDEHGIDIENVDGGVSISDTQASWNHGTNIAIDDVYGTMDYTGTLPSEDAAGSYAVQLHRVQANYSDNARGLAIDDVGYGAILIDNNGSTDDWGSEFDHNAFSNISIDRDDEYGEPGNVIIRDTSAFDSNESHGIAIYQADNVTISGVTADENYEDNIFITQVGTGFTSGGNVVIENTTANGSFNGGGININWVYDDGEGNDGNVTLTNVTANDNSEANLRIENVDGDVFIDPSEFSGSSNDYGVYIEGVSGNVDLLDVTASENDSEGVYVYMVDGNVDITNVTANNNHDTNLYISTVDGNVTIDATDALAPSTFNFGTYRGVNIINVLGDVALSDVDASNNQDTNIYIGGVGYDGEVLYTGGDVTLTDVTANNGLDLDNVHGINVEDVYDDEFGSGGNVILSGVTANGNYSSNLEIGGLNGIAHDVIISGSEFNTSGYRGIDISDVDGGVAISDTTASYNTGANIGIEVINGTMDYNGALPSADDAGSFAVQLHSVEATYSDAGRGLAIDDVAGGAILIDDQGLTVTGESRFDFNEWTNISIQNDNSDSSEGDVTIRDTIASDSWHSDGIRISLADNILITGADTTFALDNDDGYDLNFSNFDGLNISGLTIDVNYGTINP